MRRVSLHKLLFGFPEPASRFSRFRPASTALLMAMVALLSFGSVARAQSTQAAVAASNTPEKFDLGVGAFYQITNASNGNFLREDTTSSGGALVSIHQPWRPWMGYAADVGYTKFYESYNKNTVKLQSNVTDFGFSYLAQGSPIFGAHLFATIGGGIIVFSPISGSKIDVNGELPAHLGSQLLPQFNYSVGVNYPVWGHFGVRGQFRGLIYKTPDFHQNLLNTHTLRSTVEPTIGVYYRF